MASATDPYAARSPAVTNLAIATLVFGVLRIVVSIAAVWIASNFLIEAHRHEVNAPHNPEDYSGLGPLISSVALLFLLPLLLLAGIVSIVAGVLLVIAGLGLLRRSRFSRTLTLVLGALGGSLAVCYGAMAVQAALEGTATHIDVFISVLGVLVHGGYCAWVFIVLTKRKNALEFV